ncbi:permease component pf ABC-type transporter [Candidatus Regiella insecticola LSR1]|uniref:Transport permease protein n=1 Tax=Candidatus Regiella insecticola LSR1 TaxID=663321 RepID=E0WRF1_9ENTR|nr:ABC transporter permease [Candidatus Regiella insecticola]EFL92711.1 permease component pf ABC-type transporter [Candidatus Regiella insecticola LSR1]
MFNMLSSAWRYRFFIFSSIKTELRTKFIRSRLGGLWMILNPLAQVIIFAFVLSAVLSARLPGINNQYAYAIYLMAGTLGWTLFAEIVNRCLTLFIDNGNILKKLAFPKIALPLIVMGSALVNNLLLFIAILAIFGLLGHTPGMALLWLPILMAIMVALALGIGLTLGILNVFIRDIGQVVPVVMQFVFWLTPIVYMANIIPAQYHSWLVCNPLIPIVTAYQDILLYNRAPQWLDLTNTLIIALVLLLGSLVLFRKASPEMVDQL